MAGLKVMEVLKMKEEDKNRNKTLLICCDHGIKVNWQLDFKSIIDLPASFGFEV